MGGSLAIEAWVRDKARQLEAPEGWTLLEILRAHGLPIATVCEGQGICGTCHVLIADSWRERLPEARDDEAKLLSEVPGVEAGERLACQIIYDNGLDGLAVRIPVPAPFGVSTR